MLKLMMHGSEAELRGKGHEAMEAVEILQRVLDGELAGDAYRGHGKLHFAWEDLRAGDAARISWDTDRGTFSLLICTASPTGQPEGDMDSLELRAWCRLEGYNLGRDVVWLVGNESVEEAIDDLSEMCERFVLQVPAYAVDTRWNERSKAVRVVGCIDRVD